MEKNDLNLLPDRAKFRADKIRYQKLTRKISVMLLIVWVVATSVVFIIWKINVDKLAKKNEEKIKLEAEYKLVEDQVLRLYRVKQKLKYLTGILAARYNYGQSFERVSRFLTEGVIMGDLKLEGKGIFKMSCKTSDVRLVEQVENKVLEINSGGNEDFGAAELSGMEYKNGEWRVDLSVKVKG